MKFEKTQVPQTACRSSAVRTRDQDNPHDDAHLEGENSAKRPKTSEYEAYVFESHRSFGQVNVEEPGPSTSGIQEPDDEFNFWPDSYGFNDDEFSQLSKSIIEPVTRNLNKKDLRHVSVDNELKEFSDMGNECTFSDLKSKALSTEYPLPLLQKENMINLTAPTITFLGN
ncbi:hypothetical protein Tco_1155181 [Tanacetum coccineum]